MKAGSSPPSDALTQYRSKRDLRRSPEPSGHRRSARREPIFVVHRHRGRGEHYDFRLEVDGVLKSWAVPKGPSGAYALTRTDRDARGRERWLLVKKRDDEADPARDPVSTQPESVLSGRTLEQVAREVA